MVGMPANTTVRHDAVAPFFFSPVFWDVLAVDCFCFKPCVLSFSACAAQCDVNKQNSGVLELHCINP